MTKTELMENDYTVGIVEGIRKRLTDGSSKDYATLVWKVLSTKMEISMESEVQKAVYF